MAFEGGVLKADNSPDLALWKSPTLCNLQSRENRPLIFLFFGDDIGARN
jgi:hypothetical protein